MATYYHGAPEIQPDGLQTLYLMNPGFVDAAQTNMGYLNSSMGSLNPMTISHNPQGPQHLVGIPLQPTAVTAPWQDPDRPRSIHAPHEASAGQYLAPRLHYGSIDMSSQMGLWRPTAVPPHQQRLSLSLSPQQAPYKQYRPEPEVPAAEVDISPANAAEMKLMGPSSTSASADSNGISGLQSLLMGSKYLKAAQRLLDEVVSLWKGTRLESMKGGESKSLVKNNRESEGVGEADANTTATRGADLTTAEKQELQMKKAKLANMLDEVEQRYRQYRHQMQIVVSSFEAVAGLGSARTYTALALQTISKQFRCLRDAISGQIRATSKSLGEEDCPAGGARSAGSRLRFVDHHLRQQRALQQIGMIQHNTWRPQRGLPERAVSVLRAWLFEHFLHPYPKDSDKHMLAKQTGLTRSQVSNWFINARVRLWKPMVEEMYLEESKDQEQSNFNEEASKGELASKGDANEDSVSKSSVHQERMPTRTEQTDGFKPKQDSPNDPIAHPIEIPSSFLGIVEGNEEIIQPSPKKARSHPDELSNRELLMQFMDGRSGGHHEYHHPLMAGAAGNVGAFGAYGEIGRFDHEQFAQRFSVNGVSLTLGLPHSENLSLSGTHPSYLSGESINPLGRRVEMDTEPNDYSSLSSNQTASHPPNVYESISIQNRKRFAAQLLPDFVA